MRLIIDWLRITNWRGTESITVHFGTGETTISGTNKTGKSTIAEAYRWGFTGKDSLDRKDYNLKNTVKKNLNRNDHEVSIGIRIDNAKRELRRVYKEVWVRPRGKEQEVLKGHENMFFVGDVPFTESAFNEMINGWFTPIQFKILTDPLFFNTELKGKWEVKQMRDVLVGLAGEIDRSDIFDNAQVYGERRAKLEESLNEWGKLDHLKKDVAEKIRKAKEEIKGLPESIESQERTKPDLLDWPKIETGIEAIQQAYDQVTKEIFEASKGDDAVEIKKQEVLKVIREIKNAMNNHLEEVSNGFRQKNRERSDKIAEKEQKLKTAEYVIINQERTIMANESEISRLEKEKARLLSIYNEENAKELPEIDPSETKCPTCDRPYDPDKVENARKLFTSNWNARHAEAIENIKKEGSAIKQKIADAQKALEVEKQKLVEAQADKEKLNNELQQEKAVLEYKQSDLEEVLRDDSFYQEQHSELLSKERELKRLEEEGLADDSKNEVIEKLKAQKESYSVELLKLRSQLATKSQHERVVAEIDRLNDKLTRGNQAIAELEGIEFAIKSYNSAKNRIVETRVNKMFPDNIEFKLFKEQVNGEFDDDCELYDNGEAWETLNTGGKIQVGIQCISVFQEAWNLYLPIWIDNRESTVSIPPALSQVINIVVDQTKNKLTVS